MNQAAPTPQEKNLRIAAVMATMNRSATVMACIKALQQQSRPPDWIVVADNGSCDDTVMQLQQARLNPLGPAELVVHQMPANEGNAGGVQVAMDLAFALGADATWILDDDSWPRPKALEALLTGEWDEQTIRHSLQIDPATRKFTWSLPVLRPDGSWQLHDSDDSLPDLEWVPTLASWTGALIPRKVREVAGPVNGALFIRGEDEEYPWRIRQAGFRFATTKHSILDHPGPKQLVCLRLFGKHLFYEPGLADWKLYYKVRNMVWLKKAQSGWIGASVTACSYGLVAIWMDGPNRLATLLQAIRDGFCSRLGRRHQPPA